MNLSVQQHLCSHYTEYCRKQKRLPLMSQSKLKEGQIQTHLLGFWPWTGLYFLNPVQDS